VVRLLASVWGVSSSLSRAASQISAAISSVSRAASWNGRVDGIARERRLSASWIVAAGNARSTAPIEG
jgi:hypothetical protein